jgi:hypothetical protein|tara:strand:+ start:1253 stop:1462 length:210 start_codon:yes stop_codon:yes gene_type:complete
MAQCNICEVHNEVHHFGYEDYDKFLEKQCFNTAIWNDEEVEESHNILIKESCICENCLDKKYKNQMIVY